MLYSSFGSEYIALHLLVVWLDLDWTWRYGRLLTVGLLSQFGPWLNWGDKPVFTLATFAKSFREKQRSRGQNVRRLIRRSSSVLVHRPYHLHVTLAWSKVCREQRHSCYKGRCLGAIKTGNSCAFLEITLTPTPSDQSRATLEPFKFDVFPALFIPVTRRNHANTLTRLETHVSRTLFLAARTPLEVLLFLHVTAWLRCHDEGRCRIVIFGKILALSRRGSTGDRNETFDFVAQLRKVSCASSLLLWVLFSREKSSHEWIRLKGFWRLKYYTA